MILREIKNTDNKFIADIIRKVMTEFDCVGEGYSIMDREVDNMFENYSSPKHYYLIVENNGKVVGGGGIGPLVGADDNVCELKKMYFYPEARGKGMGYKMMDILLKKAKELGYKKCYLETVGRMEDANRLYAKSEFERINGPMGSTGHNSCEVQYLRDL